MEKRNKYRRGDMISDINTGITYGVISKPLNASTEYSLRTYGGDDDSEIIIMEESEVESERFIQE